MFHEEEWTEQDEQAAMDSMAEALRTYIPRARRADLEDDEHHCPECADGGYIDSTTKCRCGCHMIEPIGEDR